MPMDERDARRIATDHRRDAEPAHPTPTERGDAQAGNPSPQSENAPGSPEETRGTRGQQGKPMRSADEA